MKSSKVIIFFVTLVLVTSIAAILHLSTYQEVPENIIIISTLKEEIIVDLNKLNYEQVSGIRVNGKGEEIPVNEQGISIQELFESYQVADYVEISVISVDSYSATVTSNEINEGDKVYLLVQEDEKLRLIVFGDTNSKRSVSNVVKIIVK